MTENHSDLATLTAQILEEADKRVAREIERLEASFLAFQLLASEGVMLPATDYDLRWGSVFNVEKGVLPAVRRALGRLRAVSREPNRGSKSPLDIWITLKPADNKFCHLGFRIPGRLKKTDKCKVRTVTYKAKELVCDL